MVRETLTTRDLVLNGADYLAASPRQLRTTVHDWLGVIDDHPRAPTGTPRKPTPASPPAPLISDGGRGKSLLASAANGIRTCAPTSLPSGFWWPSTAAHSYAIAGHPAIALYATAGSGESVLWIYTTWQDPPILESPTATIKRNGRGYDLYRAGGHLHMMGWRIGSTRAWLTNTLRDNLTTAQMIALASSCR